MSSNKSNKALKTSVKADNFVDYIFDKNPNVEWELQGEEVVIKQYNKGVFNRIAQFLFKKPKISYIHMEEMGSFIWPLVDGKKSVYEIGKLVHERFGEKAEPLYERLSVYMKQLESYGFLIEVDNDN